MTPLSTIPRKIQEGGDEGKRRSIGLHSIRPFKWSSQGEDRAVLFCPPSEKKQSSGASGWRVDSGGRWAGPRRWKNQIKSDSKGSPEEACGQRAADDNKHSLSSLRSTFHLSSLLLVSPSTPPPSPPLLPLLFLPLHNSVRRQFSRRFKPFCSLGRRCFL